jgi:hypothetical protein
VYPKKKGEFGGGLKAPLFFHEKKGEFGGGLKVPLFFHVEKKGEFGGGPKVPLFLKIFGAFLTDFEGPDQLSTPRPPTSGGAS